MKKQGTERRVYTGEFKAEAVALAEKRDKWSLPDYVNIVKRPYPI